MKITGKAPVDPKILQGTTSSKTATKGKAAGKNTGKADQGATVTLSSKAKDFQRINHLAKESEGVDAAKVERIKKAIKEGKFDVNYDKLAEKIVENDIMYELIS
jgi:flagellar biosynthesis anti-sigma factor FlgM